MVKLSDFPLKKQNRFAIIYLKTASGGANTVKKLLFVFNPHSGKGQIRQHLMTITDIFTKGGYEVTVHPTQCKNDAYEKILSRGRRIIVGRSDL